jgi:hypothetical protein
MRSLVGRPWWAALALAACGPLHTLPLLTAAGAAVSAAPPPGGVLEVVTRGTGVADPLRVDGTRIAYTDVEAALSTAVAAAAAPWADAHRAARPDGYQLFVELTRAQAQRRSGRTRVTLGVRATLRARQGLRYLAQTQAVCSQAAIAEAAAAAPVLYGCMTRIGRDLAGWLGAVEP